MFASGVLEPRNSRLVVHLLAQPLKMHCGLRATPMPSSATPLHAVVVNVGRRPVSGVTHSLFDASVVVEFV